jgi:alpha-ribazole phosphatase/probable phosphoglycerate mutase
VFVYLLRHGQTVYNADGERFCGSSDVGLTALGWQQARQSATLLKEAKVTKVIHSGLRRAEETATALVESLDGVTKADFHVEPAFREVGFGAWEGLTRAEAARAFPDVYSNWLLDPAHTSLPGGDDLFVRQALVLAAFQSYVSNHPDGDIVIVAHNTINRLLLVGLFGGDAGEYRKLVQRNACMNVIEYTDLGDFRIHGVNLLPV